MNDKKIMDDVKEKMRLKYYSIHTERNYCDWIKRYIIYHKMSLRLDFAQGERKIEEFLTDLAVNKNISPATQNQAMNALVFLYTKVLMVPLNGSIDAVRATSKLNIPLFCTRGDVRQIIGLIDDLSPLMECLLLLL